MAPLSCNRNMHVTVLSVMTDWCTIELVCYIGACGPLDTFIYLTLATCYQGCTAASKSIFFCTPWPSFPWSARWQIMSLKYVDSDWKMELIKKKCASSCNLPCSVTSVLSLCSCKTVHFCVCCLVFRVEATFVLLVGQNCWSMRKPVPQKGKSLLTTSNQYLFFLFQVVTQFLSILQVRLYPKSDYNT